ncbi:fic family toxin-antitoxin system, toxin component [Streptomyces sp. NPDC047453]|uniref:fic family toxin-antitoxin system, toxin component n=1 Tax=Streptomyces sp. NPDC047453 TaxID=3154812 RepID=UPI0033CE261D
MILRVDRGWLLEIARQNLPGAPDVTDYGTLAAAAARHTDEVMGTLVYTQPHHRAAALMHQLIRVPGLETFNELFGVVAAPSYLAASGLTVIVEPKDAVALAAQVRDGLGLRDLADEIRREWIAG